ncbi:MAG: redoxin family protein [Chitinophagaceae bacterium]|nr:redoxin family protein [Chitinophagaceae bacterium]
MIRYFVFLFFFVLIIQPVAGQKSVTISPEYPMPGDWVSIVYTPQVELSDGTIPVVRFTYSNFYELPQKIEMGKKGVLWETSFKLPPYAVLATFVIDAGDQAIQPAGDRHYAIRVYNKDHQLVRKSYLYKGYSLSAQEGKSPGLKGRQAKLFEEELKHYPDNYEAKLRLLSYKISIGDEAAKKHLYKEANEVIAKKFYENPGNMGHTNSTTMGYLIMGEKSRLDSLREVIKQKYPNTEAGYELRIGDITEMKDSVRMISALEEILKEENDKNKQFLTSAHEALFEYYARAGSKEKTLYHLSFLDSGFTPYTPKVLKDRATLLYKYGILPDTALAFAQRSLALADTFPISLIRYFPETGYLPSFVSRQQREASVKEVTGRLKSLMALIQLQKGNDAKAKGLIKEAIAISADDETLKNAGSYYTKTGDYASAFQQFRKVAYQQPEDTAAYQLMERNYKKWKGSMDGFETFDKEIKGHWMEVMTAALKNEIINKPMPDVLSQYVDLAGNPLPKDFIKNKIVVMDFWATWCVPCMKAMPFMESVYQQYKNDPSVVFMIVNSGSQNELSDAQNWWGNKAYSFPVYYNKDRTIGDKLGFNLIPATYIIDKDGNIRFKTLGFEGSSMTRKIAAQIEMLKN